MGKYAEDAKELLSLIGKKWKLWQSCGIGGDCRKHISNGLRIDNSIQSPYSRKKQMPCL